MFSFSQTHPRSSGFVWGGWDRKGLQAGERLEFGRPSGRYQGKVIMR
jgi:hypothetical protein